MKYSTKNNTFSTVFLHANGVLTAAQIKKEVTFVTSFLLLSVRQEPPFCNTLFGDLRQVLEKIFFVLTYIIKMNNFFEENVKVRYSEMDYDLVLKPSALLQFLQDMASENAEKLGFGYSYIIKHNLAWFLLKYHMEFSDYPKGLYDLTLRTEPRGYNKMFAFRDFEILNEGKTIGRAASTWALVDLDTKSMANTADALNGNPYMTLYEKRENDLSYGKVRPPQKIDIEKTFEIRFDDLDVNQHVNNANYIVWAFEPLKFDFRKEHKLKTLDMVFKKEIKYGSNVITQIEINDNITTHAVKNKDTGEELCLVLAEWIKK